MRTKHILRYSLVIEKVCSRKPPVGPVLWPKHPRTRTGADLLFGPVFAPVYFYDLPNHGSR